MSARRRQGLAVARLGWIAFVAMGLALYAFSIPRDFAVIKTACSGLDCLNQQLSPSEAQQLAHAGISPDLYAGYMVSLGAFVLVMFTAIAALIFYRKRRDWTGLFFSFVLFTFAISFTDAMQILTGYSRFLDVALFVIRFSGNISIVLLVFLFPDGRLAPRWMRWVLPLVLLRELLGAAFPDSDLINALFYPEVLVGVTALILHYRLSAEAQRRQTRWVVFGFSIGILCYVGLILLVTLISGGRPNDAWIQLVGITFLDLFILTFPLSIGIAILRSRLWDIDVIIRRTLIYGVLTVLLALFYFGGVVLLQQLFRALTGQGSDLAIILSTLAIAALFIPLRNRVQQIIDRRFYRRKYDAAKVLAAFAETARDEVDLTALSNELLTVVEETVQPADASLWLARRD